MTVYYLTILAVLFFSFLAIYKNNSAQEKTLNLNGQSQTKKFWLLIVALILICVAGLRYYVGTDYGAYYKALTIYPKELWTSIKEFNEPGFPILTSILKFFTNDGAVFIFVASAFTIGTILFITYKHTDTYLFTTLLFIFVGVWQGTFNGVRQYFAAAIICLGHRYIFDKKFWKYLLCVFIAYLFHSSAIIMIIPYFILRNKISLKNMAILIIGVIILITNYEFIFSFVGNLKNETIDTTQDYMNSQVNPIRVVVCVVSAVFCLLIYSGFSKDEEQVFYLNILILYALLSVIGMNSPYLSRVNIYLQVLLPLAMGKLISFKGKTDESIIKMVIVVLFFLFWLYETTNSTSLYNFRWIWER